MSEHKHVFKISESITKSQPDSEDSLRSLQLKKLESIVQSSAGKVSLSDLAHLNLTVTTGQQEALQLSQGHLKESQSVALDDVLELPKPVEKQGLLG